MSKTISGFTLGIGLKLEPNYWPARKQTHLASPWIYFPETMELLAAESNYVANGWLKYNIGNHSIKAEPALTSSATRFKASFVAKDGNLYIFGGNGEL